MSSTEQLVLFAFSVQYLPPSHKSIDCFYLIWPAGGGVLKENMRQNTVSSWLELAWQISVYSRCENGEKRGDCRGHKKFRVSPILAVPTGLRSAAYHLAYFWPLNKGTVYVNCWGFHLSRCFLFRYPGNSCVTRCTCDELPCPLLTWLANELRTVCPELRG